ncbi:MAG: hypothetical protein F4151_03320 [Gammaproteobacteria bacterium]|nr:hypothetical protein [Gammaproteobacteria bacterium]
MKGRLTGRFAALLLLALPLLLFPLQTAHGQQPPGAPANFMAAPGDGRAVTLTWDNPDDPTITAYQLRRTADGVASDWLQFGGSSTVHVSANIQYGVRYTFELRAMRGTTAGAIATVTVGPRPAPSPPGSSGGPVGGFVGGGGGAPEPSEADFEWTVTRDIEALASGHDRPTGAWSDGSTLWLANNADGPGDAVHAYDLATGERIEEREFALDERNRAPRGVWGSGGTAWVSDSGRDRLFAYDLASAERLPERDIELVARNAHARGLWGGGGRIWVLDGNRNSLFAYSEASGDLLAEYGLDAANGEPHGLWSDGVTVWVSDHGAKRLFAYRLPDPAPDDPAGEPQPLERVRDEEFSRLTRASNNSPRGIWSDGEVMYVADAHDGRVYTYNMPDAIDARLASLVVAGVEFGEFSPLRTEYEGGAETGVEVTTVEAVPAQAGATVAIEPHDADGDGREGYQVTLAGTSEITVTVTSPDGSRTRVYRVTLAGAEEPLSPQEHLDEPWAHCLKGAVAGRFSLVVYEGGSVESLAACAESRGIAVLYALHEGRYLAYILAAPHFVNRPFAELYRERVPAFTPLVVAGRGPASEDPVGEVAPPGDWPACLHGAVAPGFSAVVYAGGSVEDLAACAHSREVTALYVLHEGGWVSYIPGAPAFVNRAFGELFPDGVPALTPLVVKRED